ncbi:mRNA-decapping enzyme 1A isoform X2 [Xenopus laevis]|uniref:5'-(N(7)-methylguanosine 5'-triphospho)-[mRNA] hydrolase n=1 Tax=Xenopus laevis TaxID=8355 RepID=A0A8J0U361_XENLA|nr:mRNA-decapping enzyme 1A isoform X2 [Xenopus laevis]
MAVRDKAGQEMSLAALRQSDPYISSIVDVTGHVALYRFSPKANEWEKTDVEGTLFVYTRSAFPHHGFTIMNRLNMHNLVEPVNKDLEFQLHDPFLLYRNSSLAIYSIWFYDKSDCQRIAKLMTQVVQQELERAKTRKSPSAVNGCTDQPIDILEMLSKAKNEYEQGQGLNDSGNGSYSDKSNYKKADSLETSENSASTQEKAGHKHLTVEELFGTSLPKEQPASCFPSLETRDRRHQFYAPAPHEQPKPVVVKNVVDKKESDILPQPKCLTKVVSATPYVTPMSTVGPSVLMSPSVFHPSVREETARMSPIDSALSDSSKFVLQRSQLQETLIRFIKTDSGFLNSLHDVYLQLYAKSADNGKL